MPPKPTTPSRALLYLPSLPTDSRYKPKKTAVNIVTTVSKSLGGERDSTPRCLSAGRFSRPV